MRFAGGIAVLAVLGVLAGLAGATPIVTQVEPAASLALAEITVRDMGTHIELDLYKHFYSSQMMGSPLVLQVVLTQADAGKDIWLVNGAGGERVENATGVNWTDFHFVLANVAAGWPQPLPQFADARFVTGQVSSDVFGVPALMTNTQIDFLGGPLVSGSFATFSGIRISHNGAVDGTFYLKEIPTPEPASLGLMLLGGLAMLRRRSR